MSRSLISIAAAVLTLAPCVAAQDAYTVCQSQTRIRLRATLASGGPVMLVVLDGEMATIAAVDGERKLGLSARLLEPAGGAVEVRAWELRAGASGESIRARGRFELRLGESQALSNETSQGLVTAVELLDVLAPVDGTASEATLVPRAKCCVTCSGTTACSSCSVDHECGSCCAGTCCPDKQG